MIQIVDYGVGNIQAFLNLFKSLNIEASKVTTSAELLSAPKIVLPGVGHFDHAMHSLNQSGMRGTLDSLVLEKKIPVIGICVGMQMLADSSEEGILSGLGWVPGRVKSFANHPLSQNLPMPHMGWNDVVPTTHNTLLSKGFEDFTQFYFLHSFYFDAQDKSNVAATANYGFDFDVLVSRGHIHGIQCHPEKSHHWGAQLLKNFVEQT